MNGQLNKEEFEQREKLCGETLLRRRPSFKKPLKTRVKHLKRCNHYLDKDRTHIVLENKSVMKTETAVKILKGSIKA